MTPEKRLSVIPTSMQGIYRRSHTSRAAAIKSMCLECCGYQRKEVTACTDTGCPLWKWRPYQ